MTVKQLYEYTLAELNKSKSPTLLVEDYNYFINKTIMQYINKMYNAYEVDQQKSDDLRVLKSSAIIQEFLPSVKTFDSNCVVKLPDDYLHILSCVIEYIFNTNEKCNVKGSIVRKGAKRLTSDMSSQIINNYYMRPSYKNPYYYINNISEDIDFPILDDPEHIDALDSSMSSNLTSIILSVDILGDITLIMNELTYVLHYVQIIKDKFDFNNVESLCKILTKLNIPTTFFADTATAVLYDTKLHGITSITSSNPLIKIINGNSSSTPIDLRNKQPEYRYGNTSKVKMEIRYGVNTKVKINKIYIDYIRSPKFIKLTKEQIDNVIDNSQLLEFPDYVCHEILNELIHVLLENSSDPRLQTHLPISQSIASQGQPYK